MYGSILGKINELLVYMKSSIIKLSSFKCENELFIFLGIHMVNKKEMEAFHETKNDRPDWERENTPLTKDAIEKNIQIPEDLKCQICQDLMKDAVMMPSCGCSMCDECARDALIKEENTKKECPICGEPDNSPDELIPVRKTREDVKKFRSAHMKEFAGAELNPVSALDNKNEQQKPLTLPDIPLPGISDVNLFKPEPETTSRSSPLHHYNKSPDAFYKSPVDNSNYDSLTPKYTPKVLLLEMIYIYIVLFFIFLKFQV